MVVNDLEQLAAIARRYVGAVHNDGIVAEVFAVDLDPHLFARIELECCRFTHVLWIVARAARCGYGLAGPDLVVGMGVGIPGFSPVAPA